MSHDGNVSPSHALRVEIELLRGAVAALRATRKGAVSSAREEARAATWRSRLLLALVAFVLGALTTAAFGAIARAVFFDCP
jgi:hypothetical protein